MNQKLSTISMVLKIRKYAMLAVITSIGLGLLYYFLTMSFIGTHLAAELTIDPSYIFTSIGMTVVIASLGGINIALVAFKMKRERLVNMKKTGSSAIFGGALSAFTPGCPACTTPLAVVLGAVGGLAIFPMQGLELKFISIAALIFSIYWITRSIQRPSCCSVK